MRIKILYEVKWKNGRTYIPGETPEVPNSMARELMTAGYATYNLKASLPTGDYPPTVETAMASPRSEKAVAAGKTAKKTGGKKTKTAEPESEADPEPKQDEGEGEKTKERTDNIEA